jgi:hypothetical protein
MSLPVAGDFAGRGIADAVASWAGSATGGAYPDAAVAGGTDDVAAG